MQLPVNHFKRAIQSEQTQFGLWMGLPSTSVAEIGAGAGFDWVLIDGEHAPFGLIDIQNSLQAIAPYDTSALVRPVEGSVALIKQLLDIGAQTLLVPMVDTAEQAVTLAQAVRYPPHGIRGLGTSMARAARWNGIEGYLHNANQEVCLIVQAETTTALENIDAIAAVEGVDGVFIGPSDLSASMGYIGQPAHPEVIKAIGEGVKKIHAAGKAAGVLAVAPQMVDEFIAMGVNFIGVGVDVVLLANATRQLAAKYKSPQDKVTATGY